MKDIEILADWMLTSEHTVIFTGAGMSTESGLPDYRSSSGLWKEKDALQLASTEALNENFNEFINFYQQRINQLREFKPHGGHQILAQWQNDGLIGAIITQNVDGFHQAAGANNVIELHGSLNKMRCSCCDKEYCDQPTVHTSCSGCNGKLRPCVVLYGERLPETALEKAYAEAKKSRLFIVMGSSLEVSPANRLPLQAMAAGARLCIINRGTTSMDDEADLIIHANIGEVLEEIDTIIKKQQSFI